MERDGFTRGVDREGGEVKLEEWVAEQRKDWRFCFWEAVYWPWFTVVSLWYRIRFWLRRNKSAPKCTGHCFICEDMDCLEGAEVRAGR